MPSKALIVIAALALPAALAPLAVPAAAQERTQLKDILDKAQSERDKREVDDLIRRLERPGAKAPQPVQPAPPSPAPQVATPPPAPPPVAPSAPTPPEVLPPLAVPAPPPAPAPPPVAAPPTPVPPIAAPAQPPAPPPAPTPPPAPPVATPAPPPPPAPPAIAAPTPPAAPIPAEKAMEMARRDELPSADIVVFFEFNRSDITPQAIETLRVLGQAMSDPRFRSAKFLIAGHTDARGSAAYNQALSQARAEAVRRYLIETFKFEPGSLTARGFGESKLKNPRDPRADENRRVQIINLTGGATTGRTR